MEQGLGDWFGGSMGLSRTINLLVSDCPKRRSGIGSRSVVCTVCDEVSMRWDVQRSATKGAGWRRCSLAAGAPSLVTPAPLPSGGSDLSSAIWWRSPYPALLVGAAQAFGFTGDLCSTSSAT